MAAEYKKRKHEPMGFMSIELGTAVKYATRHRTEEQELKQSGWIKAARVSPSALKRRR
jgi:hypothetical protein